MAEKPNPVADLETIADARRYKASKQSALDAAIEGADISEIDRSRARAALAALDAIDGSRASDDDEIGSATGETE